MTSEQFCYWLQGCLETLDGSTLTERQVQIIKDHLALVFTKVTPDRPVAKLSPETDEKLKGLLDVIKRVDEQGDRSKGLSDSGLGISRCSGDMMKLC